MATSTQNCDREFMLRLFTLILDGGSYVYRKVLEDRACERNNDLQTHLNNSKIKIGKHVSKHLSPGQFEILFPNNGPAIAATAEEFDITLLAFLIQNTCTDQNEVSKWTNTQPGDNSTIADLARVRMFRNNILHSSTTKRFDEVAFRKLWSDIETVLLRLSPNDQILVDKIKAWQTEPLDKDLESEGQKSEQQLKQWQIWEEVQKRMDILEKEMEKLKNELKIRDTDVPKIKVTDKYIQRIAQTFSSGWQAVGTELGLTNVQMSHIERDYRESVVNQIVQMLSTWKRIAENSTLDVLVEAIVASGVSFDKDLLRKIISEIRFEITCETALPDRSAFARKTNPEVNPDVLKGGCKYNDWDVPKIEVKDKYIQRIAQTFPSGWQAVGTELGLSNVQMSHIERDYRESVVNQIVQMLSTWKLIAEKSTLDVLVEATVASGVSFDKDLLRKIISEICQENETL